MRLPHRAKAVALWSINEGQAAAGSMGMTVVGCNPLSSLDSVGRRRDRAGGEFERETASGLPYNRER
jgi:hypothetical protein